MTVMMHGAPNLPPLDPVLPRWWRTIDKWILATTLLLIAIGLLAVISTTPPEAMDNGVSLDFYIRKQVVFALISIALILALSVLSPDDARRVGTIVFLFSLVCLMLLPIFGITQGKGAARWLSLPGLMSFQPSEFLKPGFVVACAWLMTAKGGIYRSPGVLITFVLTVLIALTLVLQPDYGQASMIIFAWGVIYFVKGAPIRILTILGALTTLAGFLAFRIDSHFRGRVSSFLDGAVDPFSQVGKAIIAIHEGWLFGKGIGKGSVKMNLPDGHTDFVMAAIAEEFGLVGALFILSLFGFIVIRALILLCREQDIFIRTAGTGLAALFGIQAFINIGVTSNGLPAKGMTLPFISYGGSSLVAVGIGIGLLLAFTRRRPGGDLGKLA